MGDHDDTLGEGGNILTLVGKTGQPEGSCADSLRQLEVVKEQIVSGRLSSVILFAI